MNNSIAAPALPEKVEDQVLIIPEAVAAKNDLLAKTKGVLQVTTPETRELLYRTSVSMKGHIDQVEADRVALVRPWMDGKSAIDAVAKKHSADLISERNRVNVLLGSYDQGIREAAEKERQRLLAEEARLERERQAAAQAAEAARIALEKAQAKPEVTDRDELFPSTEKAKTQEELAEEQFDAEERAAALERQQRQFDSDRVNALASIPSKPAGGALRTEIEVTVTSVKELYASFPMCVKLVPDLAQIKWTINNNLPESGKIPGVTFVKRAVLSTRG